MALKIEADLCTACSACESECPNEAIWEDLETDVFAIDPDKCSECVGFH
ncbi:MAG: 4Fe-4S binding protein, partial [Rhodospirillales bacterium]